MIKLQAIGHLGKDAIVNNVAGKTVINFSVAHSEKYKDQQGNQQSKTIWVECSWWTDRTNIAPYLKKGTQVHVDGNPEVRTYPKNDGSTGATLSLRVLSVQLLGSPAGDHQTGAMAPPASAPQYQGHQMPAAPIEDLPF